MDKKALLEKLTEKGLDDVLELIEDAEEGHLTELELVPSIGLLYDEDLNRHVLDLLEGLGVKIIYVTDDE